MNLIYSDISNLTNKPSMKKLLFTLINIFVFISIAMAQVPSVKPVPANRITYNSVHLNALVNPNNLATTISFEYGLTTAYGSSVNISGTSTGNISLFKTLAITGLSAGKTYHFRVKAVNGSGTSYGNDRVFTTGSNFSRNGSINLGDNGLVYAFGNNFYGQLGDNSNIDKATPVNVLKGAYNGTLYLGDNPGNPIISVSSNIALAKDGTVYAFGDNSYGQLGDGTHTNRYTPIRVLKGSYIGTTYLGDNPNNPIISIYTNGFCFFYLAADGTLFSCGDNIYGQLGDGSTINRFTPVKVLKGAYNGATFLGDNPNNPIISVVSGGISTLALAADGTVFSFGNNQYGQLGDGTKINKNTPVKVLKGTYYTGTTFLGDNNNNPIISIAGGSHSIALAADGTIFSFGNNLFGECGNYSSASSLPLKVIKGNAYTGTTYLGDNSNNPIIAITAGNNHSLALAADGLVYSFGRNSEGQLGENTTTNRITPVKALKGSFYSGTTYLGDNSKNPIISISVGGGGDNSFALTADGKLYSFGDNQYGQLGNNTKTSSKTAVKVLDIEGYGYLDLIFPNSPKIIAVPANKITYSSANLNTIVNPGGSNTTIIFEYGLTTAYGNSVTLPGTVTGTTNIFKTQAVNGLLPGKTYHYRLKAFNSIDTVLGSDRLFTTGSNFSKSASAESTFTVGDNGIVYAFGKNFAGILGDNTTTDRKMPIKMLKGAYNGTTYLGDNPNNPIISISGHSTCLALAADGTVYALGDNSKGGVGDNTNVNRFTPVKVLKGAYNGTAYLGDNPNNPIISISSKAMCSIALAYDGTVYSFGFNIHGQLGDNTTIDRNTPVKVLKGAYPGTTYLGDNPNNPIVSISDGVLFHTLALAADGAVYSFGSNTYGQLGDNTTTDRYTPVRVLKGAYNGTTYLGDNPNNPIISVSGGSYSSILLAADGTVYSFGWNVNGQLGDNTTTNRYTPIRVLKGAYNGTTYLGDNSSNPIIAVSEGTALATDGTLYTFGGNTNGQLGDNTAIQSFTPIRVLKGAYNGTNYLGDNPNNPVIAFFLGSECRMALAADGTVYTFGYNYYGQLGDNSTTNRLTPVNALSVGGSVVLDLIFPYGTMVNAVPANRITYTEANLNALVNPNNINTTISFEYGLTTSYGSTAVVSGTSTGSSLLFKNVTIKGLEAGKTYHFRAKAVNSSGTIYGNDRVFTTGSSFVKSNYNDSKILVGDEGIVYAFGRNQNGELGDGTTINKYSPQKVSKGAYNGTTYLGDNPNNPIISVVGGGIFTLALAADGTVYSFGHNGVGELGDNTNITRLTPVKVLKGAYNGTTYLGDNPSNPIISISAGFVTSLALAADGKVYAFGANTYGQLGNNTTTNSSIPLAVLKGAYNGTTFLGDDPNNPIISISSRGDHNIVLAANGTVYSFGRNDYGQLGDGTTNIRPLPIKVLKGEYSGSTYLGDNIDNPIIDISVGGLHSLSLAADGTLYNFGYNGNGQLGDSSGSGKLIPVRTKKGGYTGFRYLGDNINNPIVSISAGWMHSMVLAKDGSVYSFGINIYGQLGDNTTTQRNTPIKVLKGAYNGTNFLGDNINNPIIAISLGTYYSQAMAMDGTLYSFGQNNYGELGDYTVNQSNIPVQNLGIVITSVLDLIFPYSTMVNAVPANRITYTEANLNTLINPNNLNTTISFEYGLTTSYGSIAMVPGTFNGSSNIFKTLTIKGLKPGKTYHFRAKAVNSSGTTYGNDRVFITGSNFAKSTITSHSIMVRDDGTVYAFGYNQYGQLGDGTTNKRQLPIKVLKGAYNGTSYLGDNPNNPIIAVSGGTEHSIALAADGTVYTFGWNNRGRLGNNTTTDSYTPIRVLKGAYNGTSYLGDNPNNPIIAISAGRGHSIALASDGTLYAFGFNAYGQLGDSTTSDRYSPIRVLKGAYNGTTYLGDNSNNPIISITAGLGHVITLTANGAVYAFGENISGCLGDNTKSNRYTPIRVLKGAYDGTTYLGDNSNNPIISISAGAMHVITLTANGAVYAFGENFGGCLGDNTDLTRLTPVKVLKGVYVGTTYLGDNINNPIVSISAGWSTSAALAKDGLVYCFGSNGLGALGDSSLIDRYTPIKVFKGEYTGKTNLGDNPVNPIISISGANSNLCYLAEDGTIYLAGSWFNKLIPTQILDINGKGVLDLIYPYYTSVNTVPANRITYTEANLNTLVYPNNLSTTIIFEFGLTTAYGSTAVIPGTSNGGTTLLKTFTIKGLLPGKTYHYRAKAVNIRGTLYGNDMVFTTGSSFSKSTVGNHTLNIADNGIVYTIGGNTYGELGDNSKIQRRTPIKVVKGAYNGESYLGDNINNPIIGGSAGGDHSIILDANGLVYTFGYNTYGQLGDGSTTNRTVPVKVVKGEYNGNNYLGDNPNNPIIAVSAGVHFSLALAADGTLYSFGDNAYGQLGDSSNVLKTSPVKVMKGEYNGTRYLGDYINNPIILISAGRDHSIVLAANGNVFAFGRNGYGELGDSSIIKKNIPVKVKMGEYSGNRFLGDNPLNPIVSLSAGIYHSMALGNNGTVYTFGWNAYGQLGDNTTSNRSIPVKVLKGAYVGTTHLGDNPNSRIVSVSAGLSHSIALDAEGAVYAFGENLYGQLGNNTNTNSSIPVRVLKGTYKGTTYLGDNSSNPGIAISVGIYHSTVVALDGTVYSFGWNLEGQLGDNTITNRNIPIQTLGVGNFGFLDLIYPYSTTVIAVPVNRITYNGAKLNALVNPNNLNTTISFEYGLTKAYGSNAQVTGTSTGDANLFKTLNITGLIPGKTYHYRAKAVNSSDTIYGSDRVFTTGSSFSKSKFSNHTIAVRDDGIVYSFGDNKQGQLGDNTSAQRTTPIKVLKGAYNGTTYLGDNPNNPIIAVSSGSMHSIALAADGTVYAFGDNAYGQLGNKTNTNSSVPVRVLKGNYIGTSFLGDNPSNPIISICAGNSHSIAIASNGTVYAFGSNQYGQLGDNSIINKMSPVEVLKGDYAGVKSLGDNPNNPIISVTAGSSFSMALSADGTVYAYGANAVGQLGDNTTIQRNVPIKVLKGTYIGLNYLGDNSINPIISLSAGFEHVIALSADGLVYAIGGNDFGQLGDNSTVNKSLTNNVLKGSYAGNIYLGDYSNNKIVSISTGAFHSVTLAADGTVYTFGGNNNSQLGNNQNVDQLVPIKVLLGAYSGNNYFGDNIDNPIVAISGGNEHTVAMAADGTFYSFGYNAFGQLGDNSTTNRSKPIQTFGVGGSSFLDLIFPYSSANVIEDIMQNELFSIYPNPAKDELVIFNVNQKLNGSHIIIYDMIGRKMIEETITNSSNEHSILVDKLNTGTYILSLQRGGRIIRLKFMKE